MCYGAGAGVSEPGLNRWPDNDLHLRYGGGLKILWRRPSWVQVPPPAPLTNKIPWVCKIPNECLANLIKKGNAADASTALEESIAPNGTLIK